MDMDMDMDMHRHLIKLQSQAMVLAFQSMDMTTSMATMSRTLIMKMKFIVLRKRSRSSLMASMPLLSLWVQLGKTLLNQPKGVWKLLSLVKEKYLQQIPKLILIHGFKNLTKQSLILVNRLRIRMQK